MNKKILVVVGTRPNFIKVTQFRRVASNYPVIDLRIVHTGQHFDGKMADVFFEQFGLVPDYFLNVPPGSPSEQMKEISVRLEKTIDEFSPDLIVVVGDVNSTLAAAQTAKRMGIRLAHVESGLRSFDNTMPEEYNRIQTDGLAELHFVTEQAGLDNLAQEGKNEAGIYFVGNTMIDTMVAFANNIEVSPILNELSIEKEKFVLVTMHRPATVDEVEGLIKLLTLLTDVAKKYKVIFPVHPRTVKNMQLNNLYEKFRSDKNIIFTEPLDYFSFQKLIKSCKFILTDSGGIQEESTFLGIPCLTLRPNTERPVTVKLGTNELLPFDLDLIRKKISEIENGTFKKGEIPPLWDGHASERIFEILSRQL